MPSFTDLGVRADIVTRLATRDVVEPFPIQAATISDALAGRDVCGRAPTGSGKTIAFGIPLVSAMRKAAPRAPRGLVLVPTRELAAQVAAELVSIAGPKTRVATVYGGVPYGAQLTALRRGADILVACPGRLKDLVDRNECRLDDVSFVVVDEADRMADMGFLPEVRRLLDMVRGDRQTLLFSATLDGDIAQLIANYQHDPVRHEVERSEDHVENVHHFWKTNRTERVKLAAAIVSKEYSSIVFCRTKHGVDRLVGQLEELGLQAAPIHGDRTQRQRERALAAFTSGKVQCLVATDIAARGIHVDNVGTVVHFDPPGDDKDYIHRSGRTGRAGAAGTVVSLIMPDQVKLSLAMQRRLGMDALVDRPADGVYDTIVTTPRPVVREEARPEPKKFESRPPKFEKKKFETRKPDARKPKFEKAYERKRKWEAKPDVVAEAAAPTPKPRRLRKPGNVGAVGFTPRSRPPRGHKPGEISRGKKKTAAPKARHRRG